MGIRLSAVVLAAAVLFGGVPSAAAQTPPDATDPASGASVAQMVEAMVARHRDVTANAGAQAAWERALATVNGEPDGFTVAELEAKVAGLEGVPRARWLRVLEFAKANQAPAATVAPPLAGSSSIEEVRALVEAMIVRHRDVTANAGALANWQKALKTLDGTPGGFAVAELRAHVADLSGVPRQRWQLVLDAVTAQQSLHAAADEGTPSAGAASDETPPPEETFAYAKSQQQPSCPAESVRALPYRLTEGANGGSGTLCFWTSVPQYPRVGYVQIKSSGDSATLHGVTFGNIRHVGDMEGSGRRCWRGDTGANAWRRLVFSVDYSGFASDDARSTTGTDYGLPEIGSLEFEFVVSDGDCAPAGAKRDLGMVTLVDDGMRGGRRLIDISIHDTEGYEHQGSIPAFLGLSGVPKRQFAYEYRADTAAADMRYKGTPIHAAVNAGKVATAAHLQSFGAWRRVGYTPFAGNTDPQWYGFSLRLKNAGTWDPVNHRSTGGGNICDRGALYFRIELRIPNAETHGVRVANAAATGRLSCS